MDVYFMGCYSHHFSFFPHETFQCRDMSYTAAPLQLSIGLPQFDVVMINSRCAYEPFESTFSEDPITTVTKGNEVKGWLQPALKKVQHYIALQNPVHIFKFDMNGAKL